MPNTYEIKRVVAYEHGKEKTIVDILKKSQDEKYIEVLIPFSDPIAESPELQDASVRAMEHQHTTDDIFDVLSSLKDEIDAKIILSIYLNTAFAYGYENFCRRAEDAGVYGLNIKDMPFKERDEIKSHAKEHGLEIVHTIATERPEALEDILSNSNDVIYVSNVMKNKCVNDGFQELIKQILGTHSIDILLESR